MKKHNFHVPLSQELYARLRAESDRFHRPATQLVREAIEAHLEQLQRRANREAIAAYARRHAGTEMDIDEELALAGEEELLKATSVHDEAR